MDWADRPGVSYLGWGWFIAPGLTREEGSTLIKNYRCAPTAFGIGLREHLRELGVGEERAEGEG